MPAHQGWLGITAITNWSREGFDILQQYCGCPSAIASFCCKGGWRPVLCGSCNLTAVEGEALVVAWYLQKARLFLLNCSNFTIITDHHPLTKLLRDKALTDVANPLFFCLKEQTLPYCFQVKYIAATVIAKDKHESHHR